MRVDASRPLSTRPATPDDAPLMAQLVDMAGEGLPMTLWAGMAEDGQSALEVGIARARRDEGSFSWRNARIGTLGGVASGMIITYETAAEPDEITEDTPAMFVPLIALENLVPQTLYINVLAVLPEARGHGLARHLMQEVMAAQPDGQGTSLIMTAGNTPAERLYHGLGFREVARRPLVAEGWETDRTEWLLLLKDAPAT